jgi:transposase
MNFNIQFECKKIILNNKNLKSTYNKIHTNSKHSLDLIIDELFYFFKSGVSWKLLRSPINSKTLFWHFSKFVKNNIFLKLFNKIKNTYINKHKNQDYTLLIDSTTIYNKYGVNKIGRNKFYKNKKTTKISLMTDINGFPLSVLFMKGNYHDNSVFEKHIRDALVILPNNKKKIMADKAYSSKKNYDLLESKNITHIIPPRKNMKIAKTYKYNKDEYIKRIKIEHIFSRLKMFRRLNVRYEKLVRYFSSFVFIALSFISINIINSNI